MTGPAGEPLPIDPEEIAAVVETFVQEFPRQLEQLATWQAVLFVPLGMVSLFYGLRLFKGMVVIYAAIAGVVLGQIAAELLRVHPILGMVVGGVVLAAVAWPLVKYAAMTFGGLAGGLLATVLVYPWAEDPAALLVAGGIGFVAGLVLAMLLFRPLIIFMTAVIGAHLVVAGVVALAMAAPSVGDAVVRGLEAKRYLLPVLVGIPAVIGVIYQARLTEEEEKGSGK